MLSVENRAQFFEQFSEKMNALEKASDKWWDKMEKYESEGDDIRAKRAAARMDEIHAKQDGMETVLEMLGYTVICQDGEFKIVEYK